MKIECLVVGQLKTNCYLVWSHSAPPAGGAPRDKDAIIIDPGDDADYIIHKIQDLELKPQFIIATHGHVDHVLAFTELKLAFQIPFLMHQADLFLFKRSRETTHYFTGAEAGPPLPPDKFIKEGNTIKFGQEKLKVIETSGHTPGSISLYAPGILFSGDTLFANGLGRTDFGYASSTQLKKSLQKLFRLSLSTLVYPGHGPETTIGEKIIP